MPQDECAKYPVKRDLKEDGDDATVPVISYPKGSILESLVKNAEKLGNHATLANQVSGLVKSIASKDPYALDSNLAEKFLTQNFGENGYSVIKALYQAYQGYSKKGK